MKKGEIDHPIIIGKNMEDYNPQVLARDIFRREVFKRDNHMCVVCGDTADDAHHILERRLFPNGGYILNNGASVCNPCHIKCEQTLISPQELRELCNIDGRILPPHLYSDYQYDKWGNICLPNGTRIRGELFYDESVQKILPDEIKSLFSKHVKYPRTHHLPWSPGVTKDDRIIESLERFEGKEVVITEKMDGENTTMYRDYIHARSLDSESHPSQSWVRNYHSQIAYNIPEGWRICGENLYAIHSIKYENLPTYFQGFSVWNEKNECLSWDETVEWLKLLDIKPVPVLWQGPFDIEMIRDRIPKKLDFDEVEGYVMRLKDSFSYGDFRHVVGKYVRENHVVETKHNWRMNWDERKINKLKV